VARQLRLRDMGGLIVIDFIDMRNAKHIQEIEKALRQAVKRDKARTQVARISQFGLLELSRQRLKPTILEGNYAHCPHCEGTGWVKSTVALALAVLRRIRAEVSTDTVAAVRAILPMDVATYLQNNKRKEISRLEEDHNLSVQLLGNPAARQNEHDIEFVRRAVPVDIATAAVKARRKEVDPAPTPEPVKVAAPNTTQRPSRNDRSDREDVKEKRIQVAAVVVPDAPPQPLVVNGDASAGLAVARGRVFWRLAATTRRLEVEQVNSHRSPSTGGRSGRQSSGRMTRRTRTWWRRRNQPAQNTGTNT
jgi:ribonuclease E